MIRRRDLLRGSLAVTTSVAASQVLAGVGHAAGVPATTTGGDRLGWGPVTAQTRPWTRWWWQGSAVTEDRLAWHLRAFAEAGLGGVEVQPIYEAQGHEERVLPYLSPEWLDALGATTRHADQLGLGVDLTAGSGWNMGGPWITPELSAGRALVERWELREGQRLDVPVRTEQPPHPGLIDEERLSRPDLRPPMDPLPEPPLAALVARETGSGETIDLAARVGADGILDWTAPAGRWELVGVFSGLVLKRVERAGPGGKGLMVDCFAAEPVRRHLDRLDEALGDGYPGLRAMFHDSFENERTDWTREAVAEFARLRGYDLLPHLPDVFAETGGSGGGSGGSEVRVRVLSDVRETFSDLFLERFAQPLTDWSTQRGWLTRNQAHGSPAHLLDVYAAADIPETEYTGAEIIPIPGLRQGAGTARRPTSLTWRMASSPAHTQGKPLVAAEAITWLDQHYHVSLSQAKPAVDVLFAAGVNHIVLHGTAYSPEDAPWPGYSFYAATEVQPANTLWRDLPRLTDYVTRCQSVLQSGEHDNDVLVYWPQHDLWGEIDGGVGSEDVELTPDHHWSGDPWMYGHPTGADVLVGGLEARGWQFDWVSDRQLEAFEGGSSGVRNEHSRYRVVVVPGARLVPLPTLEKLHALAEAGSVVVFAGDLPADVPGLADLDERRARLAALCGPLGAEHGRNGVHRVGRGRIVVTAQGADLDQSLADAGAAREAVADAGLLVLRRRHEEGRHYFLANTTAERVDGWFPLGVAAASVAVLDPLHDTRGLARTRGHGADRQVRLRLDPGESLVLRTFDERRVEAPGHPTLVPTGRERALTGPWTLTFLDGGPTLPPERTLTELVSWPELGDEEADFSGTARYALEFSLSAADARRTWRLDLGDVRECASVTLNGDDLGTAWSLPFRLALGRSLRPGRNVLELEVTNLAANRVRALARRGEFVANFWVSWLDASPPTDWDPMPSGLLGPARLTEVRD